MANQRGTFSKRNREMKLKDRAKEKAERRQNRPAGTSDTKGPQIAWDQPGGVEGASSEDAAVAASTESTTNTDNDIKDGPTTPSTAKPPTSGAPSTAKPQTSSPSPTTPKPTAPKPPTSAKPQR